MFKKLRERIAEEANKLPVGQMNFNSNASRSQDNSNKSLDNFEDQITPSDSSSVIEPHPSSQFSIAEDEDGSMSEPNSPEKQTNTSVSSEHKENQSSNTNASPPYVPQTDIESEVEEPPTLNLDGISVEQLLTSIQILKARLYKYKNKYSEVVKAYKVLNEDKKKIEGALTDNQDKSLRRIAELREQCQLEQKAKAHLEENLRLMIEEKDSRITVLETQINLLKEGHSESTAKEHESAFNDIEKNELSQIDDPQEKKLRYEHDEVVEDLKKQLKVLKQQQEDNIMSMAETKKNMHEELELKEKQLKKMKDESRQLQNALEQEKTGSRNNRKQLEDKQQELQSQLENMERTMEEERKNLLKDFSRGKAEAISLIQQESTKKTFSLEEEWKIKLHNLQTANEKAIQKKVEDLQECQNELKNTKREMENLLQNVENLENEKDNFLKTIEDLNSKLDSVPVVEDVVVKSHSYQTGGESSPEKQDENVQQSCDKQEYENLVRNVEKLEKENKNLKSKEQTLKENNAKKIKNLKERLENQVKSLESRIAESQKQNVDQKDSYESKVKTLNSNIDEIRKQKNECENQLTVLQNQVTNFQKENNEIKEQRKNQIKALESRISELRKQNDNSKKFSDEKIKTLEIRVKELKKQNDDETKFSNEKIKSLELHNDELLKQSDNLKEAENKVRTLELCITELQNQTENSKVLSETNVRELERRISELMHEMACLNEKSNERIDSFKTEIIDLHNENTSLKKKHEIEMKSLESSIPNFKEEKDKMRTKYDGQIKALETQITQLKEKNANIKKKSDEQVKQLESKLSKLQQDNSSLKNKFEDRIVVLELQVSDLSERNSKLKSESIHMLESAETELKIKLDEQTSELKSKLKQRDIEIDELQNDLLSCRKEFTESESKVQEEVKSGKTLVSQLRNELSSLDVSSRSKIEELNKKIAQLEKEREQLMIQAQERVAATEVKYREDIEKLNNEIQQLQLENKEIEKLKEQNNVLNVQLDESLLVAAANQTESSEQLSELTKQCEDLREELLTTIQKYTDKESKLLATISDLKKENKLLENLELERVSLCAKNKELQNKCSINDELASDNQRLKKELVAFDSVIVVEKEQLNSEIQTLNKTIEALKIKVEDAKTVCNCRDCACGEMNSLKNENNSLSSKLTKFQSKATSCVMCDSLRDDIIHIRDDYEKKLLVKDDETDVKLKRVLKEFSDQMNVKDVSCDETVSEIIEKSHVLEEQLQKEHQLEIAALRQDIFEKDCALEEMHEYYEGIIKEKDSKLQMYSETSLNSSSAGPDGSNADIVGCMETSDWDDTWVVPEENCDNIIPVVEEKAECEAHLQQIESMQKELAKCNSELKDLRILLRLSPPSTLHSNNNFNSTSHVPEPTEYEYLRNILFEYMMGKETVTLVKVIAAVLRFNEEQTRLIVEREKAKQPAVSQWLAIHRRNDTKV